MPKATWANFEDRVRQIATHLWGRPVVPKHIGGVDIDGVAVLDSEIHCLIEITEERNLQKVRADVIKLQTAKAALFAKGIMGRCFCVVNGEVTNGMVEAGAANHIHVMSVGEFTRQFFDFPTYRHAREGQPFGSSVNPVTGDADPTAYVPVRYRVEGKKDDISSKDVADLLRQGKDIILLGEYGSGKSRCVREVFRILSETAENDFCHPLAIDLRISWGLTQSGELLRRHFHDLGLDSMESAAIRAFHAGALVVLFDGFDEIGSQAWSNDVTRLRAIRAKSLEGVKEAVRLNKGGTLICGREHYFTSSEEMFAALGMDRSKVVVLRSKNEFSETELLEYFRVRNIEADIPPWLPRRPLICQTISDLAADQFESMFGETGDEIEFWNYFIGVLCKRDAIIHVSFDPDIIFKIFVFLARLTRPKAANVGPISAAELQAAFEWATGAAPVEEASVMLQRLPSLGRVSVESSDLQFVDVYILDGLRAKDVALLCAGEDEEFLAVASAKWNNALDDLGQRVLAADESVTERSKLNHATRAAKLGNSVLASDLVASLVRSSDTKIDFEGLDLQSGEFLLLQLDERAIANLHIADSYFGELALPVKSADGVTIRDCLTPKVTGISSAAALPNWISNLHAEEFDSVANISRIKRIGLGASHEILTAIIRKTFFQKGSGRKEEALLRGLGRVGAKGLSHKILNLMIRDDLLRTHKGDEGIIYSPVRTHTRRMQTLLDELATSKDPIWKEVENL